MKRTMMIKVVLLLTNGLPISALASFQEFKLRYVSGYEVINLLFSNFPGPDLVKNSKNVPDKTLPLECVSIGNKNRDVLGINDAVSGGPLLNRPSPGFVRWLNRCLGIFVGLEFSSRDAYRKNFVTDYFPKQWIEKYSLNDGPARVTSLMSKKWKAIERSEKITLIQHSVVRLIGPVGSIGTQESKSEEDWNSYITRTFEVVEKLGPAEKSFGIGLQQVQKAIVLSDEFLRY